MGALQLQGQCRFKSQPAADLSSSPGSQPVVPPKGQLQHLVTFQHTAPASCLHILWPEQTKTALSHKQRGRLMLQHCLSKEVHSHRPWQV